MVTVVKQVNISVPLHSYCFCLFVFVARAAKISFNRNAIQLYCLVLHSVIICSVETRKSWRALAMHLQVPDGWRAI